METIETIPAPRISKTMMQETQGKAREKETVEDILQKHDLEEAELILRKQLDEMTFSLCLTQLPTINQSSRLKHNLKNNYNKFWQAVREGARKGDNPSRQSSKDDYEGLRCI